MLGAVRTVAAKTPRRKSKPANVKSSVAPNRGLLSRGFRALWRPFPLLGIAAGLSGAMFWPQIAAHLPDLSHREEFRLAWSEIEVTPSARWVPEDFVTQVRRRNELDDSVSLLDESLVEQLALAFARHPWVSEVVSVVKRAGGVRVRLAYRSPVLMVQTKRGLYPVDVEGVLLPPTDFSAADTELFPRVEGVRSTPQGPAGKPWDDPAVVGASRLAAELTRRRDGESAWDRFRLEAIVVLSPPGDREPNDAELLGLTTQTGSRIVWGHAPGADELEPSVAQKLQRLDTFLAENGPFEDLPEQVLIDVHHWELIPWNVLSRANFESSAPR